MNPSPPKRQRAAASGVAERVDCSLVGGNVVDVERLVRPVSLDEGVVVHPDVEDHDAPRTTILTVDVTVPIDTDTLVAHVNLLGQ